MGKLNLKRRRYFLFFVLQLTVFYSFSADITSISPGVWNSASVWPGGIIPSINDNVTVNHSVTITSGTTVEINSLNIASAGNLTINGTLDLNGHLTMANNAPELTTGSDAKVFINGSAYLDNKVTINLSSYFIVLGDFVKSGASNQGSISIDGAHVYVLGTINSAWTTFTACVPGTYDGTTTTVAETCDAGSFEDLINNVDPADLPDGFYDEIVDYKTKDTTTLVASSETICQGNLVTLTINDSHNPLTKISWFRNSKKFLNNTTFVFLDTISVSGEYYALYFYNNYWYRTNKILITTSSNSTFTAGAINTTGQTVCYNGDPSVIGSATAASGGDNNITYQWQSSTDAGFTSPTNIANNAATYDPPANLTVNTWYRRQAKDNTCNTTFTSSTGVWAVTVRPVFTAGAINTTGQTICYNGDPGVIGSTTAASGGDNNITYHWQSSTDVGFTSPTNIANSAATYDPPANLIVNTWYRRQAKDNTCNTTFTTSTGVWAVTVRPTFTAGTINTSGQTICYNGDPGVIGSTTAASGGDNSITYEWRANGTPIASSNTATYDPPSALTANTTYTRWAKDNTCNTTFEQSTGSWIVTVNPLLTATVSTLNSEICAEENAVFTLSGTIGVTVTYKINGGSDAIVVLAGGTANVTISTATSDQTLTLVSVTDGTCSNAITGTANVTVHPLPIIGSFN